MKKVLLQLDTDEHPSPFDAIVAHDAGVDVLLVARRRQGRGVRARSRRTPSSPAGSTTSTRWPSGSAARTCADGEEIFDEVQKAFFGPFRVSVMLDSNGCNTTAATTIARIAKARDLSGDRAVVIGLGAVGLRSAVLLQKEGCEVTVAALSPDLFGGDRPLSPPARPRGRAAARPRRRASRPTAASSRRSLDGRADRPLRRPRPACRCCAATSGRAHPTIELLADYNAAEPLGLEGTKATDDLADHDGKLVLGALAIGGPKMKVHKACVRRLFESNDQVLDTDAVYAIAKELV